jgi:hypothetical protein
MFPMKIPSGIVGQTFPLFPWVPRKAGGFETRPYGGNSARADGGHHSRLGVYDLFDNFEAGVA